MNFRAAGCRSTSPSDLSNAKIYKKNPTADGKCGQTHARDMTDARKTKRIKRTRTSHCTRGTILSTPSISFGYLCRASLVRYHRAVMDTRTVVFTYFCGMSPVLQLSCVKNPPPLSQPLAHSSSRNNEIRTHLILLDTPIQIAGLSQKANTVLLLVVNFLLCRGVQRAVETVHRTNRHV